MDFRDYCLSLPLTEEATPFDDDTLVYRVCGKIYALTGISDFRVVIVKCAPDEGIELRERYSGIEAAFHMNKKHWIQMDTGGGLPDALIRERISASYRLVVSGLKRDLRNLVAEAWETALGGIRRI